MISKAEMAEQTRTAVYLTCMHIVAGWQSTVSYVGERECDRERPRGAVGPYLRRGR